MKDEFQGVKKTLKLFRKIFGYCNCCDRYFVYPKRRRQNTQYLDDEKNYVAVCLECFEDLEKMWEEQWREYYSERL